MRVRGERRVGRYGGGVGLTRGGRMQSRRDKRTELDKRKLSKQANTLKKINKVNEI